MSALKMARANTCVSYAALIIFMIVDLGVTTPDVALASIIAIAAFKLIPLVIPAMGVFRGDVRSHIWLCFIVLIYFMAGVLRATTSAQTLWGAIEVFLSVEIFISAMLYVRWQKRAVNQS